MYTEFYGLREKPFSLSPDPRYLFLADSHREALAHLLYGIEHGEGFIAITGEVGTGKTTLCRTLLQRIEPGTEVAFIFNPQLSALELLQAINAELGLPTEALGRRELMEQLNRFLLAKKLEGRRVLLLIDEAQNLAPDTLEQVRLLSNLETDTSKLIQIILIGQPELDAILESPDLRQLRQRISVRWRLEPLSAIETRDYVRHRMRIAAGAARDVFTELALREVHRRSRGIPRLVNLLCDRALLAGYAAGARTIGLGLVTQSDQEVRGGGRALAPAALAGARARLAAGLRRIAAPAVLVALGVVGALALERVVARAGGAGAEVAAAPPATVALAGETTSGGARAADSRPRAADLEAPVAEGPDAGAPSDGTALAAGAPAAAAELVEGAQPGAPPAGGVAGALAGPATPPLPPDAAATGSAAPAAPSEDEMGAGVAASATAAGHADAGGAAPGTELGALPAVAPATGGAAAGPAAPPAMAAAALSAPAAPAPQAPTSLEEALAGSSPAAASAESLRAVLAVWGALADVPPYLPSLDDALARLEASGLSVLALRNANLATLELFNHAALLRLRAIDGTPRTVLLLGLDGDHATVVGLRGSEPLRVGWDELEAHWTRETWIAWRDFAQLPPLLGPGQHGAPVAWLQQSLAALGFLSAANRSGVFDAATRDAVMEFQRSRSLAPDGTVGPLTKVILYQALPELAIPRLVPVSRDEELG